VVRCAEYYEAYLSLPKDVERADFFRYMVVRAPPMALGRKNLDVLSFYKRLAPI
jgi:hypothetical protein